MDREEVLQKVIEKAVKNGWDFLKFIKAEKYDIEEDSVCLQVIARYQCSDKGCWHSVKYNVNTIIFSHEFAKAFWGERKIKQVKPDKIYIHCQYDMCYDNYVTEEEFIEEYGLEALEELQKNDEWEENGDGILIAGSYWNNKVIYEGWEHYLQQLALEKDRIKYLEKFL